MRLLPVATAAVSLALIGAGGTATARAVSRASTFQQSAAALERTWTQDVRDGVPSTSVTPLRRVLRASQYVHAAAWSPMWWADDGSALLAALRDQTAAAWSAALRSARARADGVLTAWSEMELQFGTYVSSSAATAAGRWKTQLATARTPRQIDQFVTGWLDDVAVARIGAQRAEVTAASGPYGGVESLLAAARSAVSVARGDNLDAGGVPSLIAALAADAGKPAAAVPVIRTMVVHLGQLHALIALDGSVTAELRTLDAKVTLAVAHHASGATGYAGAYATLAAALHAGGDTSRLLEVAAQITSAERSVDTALTAVGCGHAVPAGNVIDVDLSSQEAVFYEDGCVAGSAPVTTGMAGLRTPTGTYHIYAKFSPITFTSQWPKSSPHYYSPEQAQYGMEFASGGFFIHDAPWEPASAFGPGSEDSDEASHGCVHMPTPAMEWLYSWSPIGTTVIITA